MAHTRRFTITVPLTTTLTTNIFNTPAAPGTGVGLVFPATFALIDHMRVLNKTAGAATFSLWRGATGANAAGTEIFGIAKNVPANDHVDFYGRVRMDAADFLVGGASANTTLVLQISGELAQAG